jgi:hypothetical protein
VGDDAGDVVAAAVMAGRRIQKRRSDMTPPKKSEQRFPPGGLTPVFNEITGFLTLAPKRPAPNQKFEDLKGPKERLLMRNVIDDSGVVQPTVFVRSETFAEPQTGLHTQVLGLAVCSGVGTSQLLGGDVAVHVRNVADSPSVFPHGLPPDALGVTNMPLIGGRVVTPRQHSIGKVQAMSRDNDFPARVTIPVFYSLVLGTHEGSLAHVSENVSIEGKEPHFMEAVVKSIPPDPETLLKGREWDLVTEAGEFLKLWVKIEFRFLALVDKLHKRRLMFKNGAVVHE